MTASALANSAGAQFELTQDQHAILDQADRFARKELFGLAERMDRDDYERVKEQIDLESIHAHSAYAFIKHDKKIVASD